MSLRNLVIIVVIVVAFFAGVAWQSQVQKSSAPAPAASGEAAAPGASAGALPPAGEQAGGAMGGQQVAPPATASPGLAWSVPSAWRTLGPRPMRLATYGVPAAGGDRAGGECAVFCFGPNQGGSVAENMDRWVGQFDHPSRPERSQAEMAGFKVWRLRVKGAYRAQSGPMLQSSGTKPGYALDGAIVEGPNGLVFFKLTGLEKSIGASRRDFDVLLRSLHRP